MNPKALTPVKNTIDIVVDIDMLTGFEVGVIKDVRLLNVIFKQKYKFIKEPINKGYTKVIFKFLSKEITIHLGKNPVRGGRPAKDNNNTVTIIKMYFDFNIN